MEGFGKGDEGGCLGMLMLAYNPDCSGYFDGGHTIKEALKRAKNASSDTCNSTRILSHNVQFNGSRGSEVG